MKKFLKSITIVSLTAIAISIVSSPAKAALVTWNLNDVTFDDGGTASGSFQYDADTEEMGNWDISVTSGSKFSSLNWKLPLFFSGFNGDFFALFNSSADRYFKLRFNSPLSNAGGTVSLNTSTTGSFESTCGGVAGCVEGPKFPARYVTTGSVTTEEVPEPLTIMGTVLAGGMGIAIKRKKAKKDSQSA